MIKYTVVALIHCKVQRHYCPLSLERAGVKGKNNNIVTFDGIFDDTRRVHHSMTRDVWLSREDIFFITNSIIFTICCRCCKQVLPRTGAVICTTGACEGQYTLMRSFDSRQRNFSASANSPSRSVRGISGFLHLLMTSRNPAKMKTD